MARSHGSYQATVDIDGAPIDVWNVLTDVGSWPEWVGNVRGVDGTFVLGEQVTVHAVESNYRDVAVTVTSVDAPNVLRVEGSLFLGALRFARSFTVQALAAGGTRFQIHERHSGPLAGPAAKRTGDLQPWFDDFAASLKTRVESAASS